MAVLGVDVGGTFTDAVVLDDGRVTTAKVLTAPHQEESVLAAARAAGAVSVERFAHGTTVATNALLERKGARTAFVTTAGFEHLLHLRRQTRAHLYRPCAAWPEPLVPLERSHGVRGRMGPNGELEPLDLEHAAGHRRRSGRGVPLCMRTAIRRTSVRLSRSSGADCRARTSSPRTRWRQSSASTSVRRRLRPTPTSARSWRAICDALADAAVAAGLPAPLVMRSSGGVATPDEAASTRRRSSSPGPAAGVVGAARLAALAGIENAIAFDMGGTSTDVCLIAGGRAERASERTVDGLPIRLPTVDLHTVGAGGGSLVWTDAGGALRVGPQSAGANPGPACYGRGGTQGTVTDANLLLGRLPQQLAGGVELDRAAAERALAGIDPAAVIDVVNAEMLRALRVVSVERGHDPADFALVAFGGAGPLHACELADELGIRTVLVPEAAGVLSALGLVASDERRDAVRSYLVALARRGRAAAGRRGRSSLRGPVLRADVAAAGREFGGSVSPRPRGTVRLRRTRTRARAGRCADG